MTRFRCGSYLLEKFVAIQQSWMTSFPENLQLSFTLFFRILCRTIKSLFLFLAHDGPVSRRASHYVGFSEPGRALPSVDGQSLCFFDKTSCNLHRSWTAGAKADNPIVPGNGTMKNINTWGSGQTEWRTVADILIAFPTKTTYQYLHEF